MILISWLLKCWQKIPGYKHMFRTDYPIFSVSWKIWFLNWIKGQLGLRYNFVTIRIRSLWKLEADIYDIAHPNNFVLYNYYQVHFSYDVAYFSVKRRFIIYLFVTAVITHFVPFNTTRFSSTFIFRVTMFICLLLQWTRTLHWTISISFKKSPLLLEERKLIKIPV